MSAKIESSRNPDVRTEVYGLRTDIAEFRVDMHRRFDAVERVLWAIFSIVAVGLSTIVGKVYGFI